MPRLTTSNYLFFYHYLHEIWETGYSPFGLIAIRDQRYLRDYFQLSKDLTYAELLTQDITARRPSLPHSAGRALKHPANPEPLRLARSQEGDRRIVVCRSPGRRSTPSAWPKPCWTNQVPDRHLITARRTVSVSTPNRSAICR
jgi:hypothetical protein